VGDFSALKELRIRQIRVTARVCSRLSSEPGVGKILQAIGRSDLCSRVLVGYNKTFSSFEEARRYADRYRLSSHEHPMNVKSHLSFNLRLSDYAVIFHLKCLRDEIRSVLDIGGSAGNLFYCYDKYLHYGPDFSWIVNDVPQNNAAGRRIANERGEPRLLFVDDLAECRRVDAVLISGALHYFDALPPELMSNLNPPPRHVFINRTPVIDGQSAITVQDSVWWPAIAPAKILSREKLLKVMDAANYELVDAWAIPDLRFRIPLHPEASVSSYSGFYFRSRESKVIEFAATA
jgi:putative methyltransferase (TIGR04325 family)